MYKQKQHSKNIQNFMYEFSDRLRDKNNGGFIRDYEYFPQKGNFDIDILIRPDCDDEILRDFSELISKNSLWFTKIERNGSRRAIAILCIDFSEENDCIDWIVIELHHTVSSTFMKQPVIYSEVSFELINGLFVATEVWKELMVFRKSLKKRKYSSALEMEEKLLCNEKYKAYFEDKPCKIVELAQELDKNTTGNLTEKNGYKNKLKKFLYFYTPFLKGGVNLFTVQGPDGAGKTTVIDEIISLTSDLPLFIENFHHISSWKGTDKIENTLANNQKNELKRKKTVTKISLTHHLLRIIYKYLPEYLRQVWYDLSGYSKYVANINYMLFKGRAQSTLFIVDRYIDDQFIKQKNKNPKNRLKIIEKLFGRIIEHPKKSFILVDEPMNVYKRKQELTIDEIRGFYGLIRGSMKHRNINVQDVIVTGRTPRSIAMEIIKQIFIDLDQATFRSVKYWSSIQKEKSETIHAENN